MFFHVYNVFSLDIVGYIHGVSPLRVSQNSSNQYFDIQVQTSPHKLVDIRVMSPKGDASKRKLFVDKQTNAQPVKLINASSASSGTIFVNKATIIEDARDHEVKHKLEPLSDPVSTTEEVLACTEGYFKLTGQIRWNGEPRTPQSVSKVVRDAVLTDQTGSIPISIWEDLITKICDGEFYTLTQMKLRYFNGKCMTTTRF